MNREKRLRYITAEARVKVKFLVDEDEVVTCENCRFCIPKRHDGVLYDEYCNITDETLIKRKGLRGIECPLIFNESEGE